MRKALITVQEQQVSKPQIRKLDEIIKRNYRRFVGEDNLTSLWCRVPKGQMFTNYDDSRSSLVTLECPEDFKQPTRVAMMKAVESEWLTVTQQHPDELMLAIIEPELMTTLLGSNQHRLSFAGRIFFALNMLKSAVKAKFIGAPISFNPNL
ncbi:MAG: hypothetical protein AAF384_18235 [Pseudomonadota bacterium]